MVIVDAQGANRIGGSPLSVPGVSKRVAGT